MPSIFLIFLGTNKILLDFVVKILYATSWVLISDNILLIYFVQLLCQIHKFDILTNDEFAQFYLHIIISPCNL